MELFQPKIKIYYFRNQDKELKGFFSQDDQLVFCNNVYGKKAEEWRLFIDSSKVILKDVLLYIGNKFPSIPLGETSNMKESYGNIKFILEKIQ